MSRQIRRLIDALTPKPKGPTGINPHAPTPAPRVTVTQPDPSAPSVPPRKNLPGPTAATPSAPAAPTPSRLPDWRTLATGAAGLVGGGAIVGNILHAMGGSGGGGGAAPPAPPAGPPAPPPPPPFPKVDPKTATREEMRAAGYRDYGGGWVAPGTPATRWQREDFLKRQAVKYRTQIAANPELYNDIVAAYDAGDTSNVPGSGHAARAVATRALTAHMDAQKEAQIWTNIDNRAKQQNVAMQMGVPRGYIMAMDDVQARIAKGDVAGATAASATYAGIYGPAFALGAKNLTDQATAQAKADAEKDPAKPGVVDSTIRNMEQISTMPAGSARRAAITAHYQTASAGNAEAAAEGIKNHYQPIVREMATRLDRLTPLELSELQQAAAGMGYTQFLQYAGLTDSVANQESFKRIFGRNASFAQTLDNIGMGNAWRGLTPWAD